MSLPDSEPDVWTLARFVEADCEAVDDHDAERDDQKPRLESTFGWFLGFGLAREPADALWFVFRMTRRPTLGTALTGRAGDLLPVLLAPGPVVSVSTLPASACHPCPSSEEGWL